MLDIERWTDIYRMLDIERYQEMNVLRVKKKCYLRFYLTIFSFE